MKDEKIRYEYALRRIEELLPLVGDDMPADNPLAVELSIVSDIVVDYEKKYYPIEKPTTAQLIQLTLEEKGMTQKELASAIGVSPSRVNDYVTGRAEPTLRVARLLCTVLGIAPSIMMGL
ncbi:MAG: helix-turn-helix transcriptional regulator [Bacteroidales bacterium]|nr:helix-turn-helix transcriptional regulator [Bacteroidaceae bacterium]MBR3743764.1 helix-turn-helix transcriptional regulator [Bacteroidales bacterium]